MLNAVVFLEYHDLHDQHKQLLDTEQSRKRNMFVYAITVLQTWNNSVIVFAAGFLVWRNGDVE